MKKDWLDKKWIDATPLIIFLLFKALHIYEAGTNVKHRLLPQARTPAFLLFCLMVLNSSSAFSII